MINYFLDFYVSLEFGFEGVIGNNLVAVLVPVLAENRRPMSVREWFFFLLKIFLSVLVMNLLCSVSYVLLGKYAMTQLCGGILIVIYLAVFSKASVPVRVIYSFSFFSSVCVVYVLCFAIFDLNRQLEETDIFYLGYILLVVLMIACVVFFKAFSPEKLAEPVSSGIGIICVACLVCDVFWLLTNLIEMDAFARLTFGLTLLVLLFTAYYSMYAISKSVEEKNSERMGRRMREADRKLLETIEENMNTLRAMRHENANQYMYMECLLQEKKYGELEDFFREYVSAQQGQLLFPDCGNSVVNVVMNDVMQRAQKEGIEIKGSVDVPPKMGVTDCDICSVLFNILNNAMEYLCRRRDMSRIVSFSMWTVNSAVIIVCRNAIADEDVRGAQLLRTSKPDAAMHGYGSKVVRSIVESYDGSVVYDIKEGYFSVSVMMFFRATREEEDEGRDGNA